MDFQVIPFKVFFLLIIELVWLIGFFVTFQYVVIRMIKNHKWKDWLTFYVPLIRNVVLVLFTAKVVYSLGKYNPLLILFIVGVVFASTWPIIRDFVQGTIFCLQKGNIVGQEIKMDEIKGLIIKLGKTKLNVEQKNGEVVQIPYNQVFTSVVAKPITDKEVKSEMIIIPLPNNSKLDQLKNDLRVKLLSFPWMVIKNGVSIDFFQEKETKMIKIGFSLTNPSKKMEIEEEVKHYLSELK